MEGDKQALISKFISDLKLFISKSESEKGGNMIRVIFKQSL